MTARAAIVALVLVATAFAAHAADPVDPADYLLILAQSKLHYKINSEPSKTPAVELTCPRRNVDTRVVTHGGNATLVPRVVVAPEATKLLDEGEEFYDAEKYEQAAAKYKAAIEKDPQAVSAYLSYGDALLFSDDARGALEQYQKAIALDPTIPVGHFFAATAYARLGDKAAARESIVKALARHPAYEAVWKIADKNPEFWGIKPVVRHPFAPPEGYLGVQQKSGIDIYGGADGAYLGYAICKAVWANEKQFANRHNKNNEWSMDEERACMLNQAFGAFNAATGKDKTNKAAIVAAMPPLERHLLQLAESRELEAYILFERVGQRCPLGMSILDAPSMAAVENYVRKYVIRAAE